MIEVTAGSKYIDIDAYASCIAYAKLLNFLNIEAKAVSTTKNLSSSIVESFKKMNYRIEFVNKIQDKTIILDVCNPDMIDNIVLESNVIEVIDHHPYKEYIEYWNNRKTKLHLEEIGSVCTIIFEKIKENNKLEILDKDLCQLLVAGILDNTLNLKAEITKQRDIEAFNELMKIGNLNEEFPIQYFEECQKTIEKNLINSIEQDLKNNISYHNLPKIFSQLLIINVDSILNKKSIINEYMNKNYNDWIINIICLKDGKSYILGDSNETVNKLNKIVRGKIVNNIIELEHFKLRKEILANAKKL